MSLKDKKIIVTGGPTREWLDPVRFISNPSSGKMGIAIADAASEKSKETVFIHGPIQADLVSDKPYRTVPIESTGDLLNAVLSEIEEGAVLIMAAAPADYTPANKSDIKIKKKGHGLTIELKKTPDILLTVAEKKQEGQWGDIFVVGFAAETTDVENYALDKLKRKDLDMICLNDVSASGAGFGTDTNLVTIFFRNGERKDLPMMTKKEVAFNIIESIGSKLSSQ